MLVSFYHSYPHLFNDILGSFFRDHDIETLLRLRLTCRLLRYSVDDIWGHLGWQTGQVHIPGAVSTGEAVPCPPFPPS